ncbi:MAG: S8 family peptidase [Pseudomonadota bacterium]
MRNKPHPRTWSRCLPMCALTLALVACGGGSGSSTSSTLTGSLIDGPIQGATVFLDLNNNHTRDAGEPVSGTTSSSGAYSIDVSGLSAAEMAGASLVAIVPDSAKDADDGGLNLAAAGRTGFTLTSPMAAYVNANSQTTSNTVVSPLTTLVNDAIQNDGLSLDAATARVRTDLTLNTDPMAHYVNTANRDTARTARAAADAMGQAKALLQTTLAGQNQTMSDSETLATVTGAVRDQLTKAMAHSATRAAILNSATPLLPTALKQTLDAAPTTANTLPENLADAVARRRNGRGRPMDTAPQTFTVVFKDSVSDAATEQATLLSGRSATTLGTYSHVFKGFTATIPAAAVDGFLNATASNPNVRLVEGETQFRRHDTRSVDAATQWGLDSLDGSANSQYTSGGNGAHNGAGSTIFVVDTGIQSNHTEFGSRVSAGTYTVGISSADGQGHGTHVAGTIGGATVGVSNGVTLVPVKVLDDTGSGTLSSVLSGLDWVSNQVNTVTPSLQRHVAVNMSLGGSASSTLDLAVAKLTSQGIPVVVAAGNSNANACNFSPAREPSAITVGAVALSGSTYARAYYSNFGPCVDVFAPGSAIYSAKYDASLTNQYASLSGTSMATPHVTGWVAQLLDMAAADANWQSAITPANVSTWVLSTSAANVLTETGTGSPNQMLRVAASIPAPVTSTPPVTNTAVSIADIVGQSSKQGKYWRAGATVVVTDANGTAMPNALVTGHFSVNSVDTTVSCTTSSNGACVVASNPLALTTNSATYAVDAVSGTGMSYNASANAVNSVVINAPASGGSSTRDKLPRLRK